MNLTNFGRNLTKLFGVTINYSYSCEIKSNFCHIYKVNCFQESVEYWSIVRLTIIGVPFGDLKEIKVKTTKIHAMYS